MAQSSITSKHTLHSIFIEANVKLIFSNDLILFKGATKKFQDQLDQMNVQYPDSYVTGSLCFSIDAWKKVTHISVPSDLKSVNTLSFLPNANQRDFFIHISSDRFDVAFQLTQDTIKNFGNTIRIEQEVHGFRRIESRDLSGFIDGTGNPQTDVDRENTTLIPQGQPHENGSYVFAQRWIHHLENWEQQSVQYQQDTIGKVKKDSGFIPPANRPANSHVSRVGIVENGTRLKILRQSLPYGLASGEKGLFFVAFTNKFHNIEVMLKSMFGKTDGKQDLILRFTVPSSGSIYYAPSKEELYNL
ncbi:hypothetical protein DICPUDRAFT_153747 [Dictyostelium purpureum]|uniref:Dyp-type peroxidase family protein n=1 Tax=Dictyostelium purpureum TaxID=5786 RepID=F0ZPN6_DICPU|nr:uncharacterized protein DICPUDRAFT_153747 [Dictyostelium purpureum]EGC34093.1 hypothetical protein DICPUDRAFT_153747 [Dictyostelium purpureum]|eukprot:XP_003289386.1 hypothetical protein DICPUDRAFT_153747 [Dictyostelium purpureum]